MVQWTVESLLQHITDSDYTIQGQKSDLKINKKCVIIAYGNRR